jgi:hypothetical protein
MKTQNIHNNSLKARKAQKKSCARSIFNDTSHLNKSEAKTYLLKNVPSRGTAAFSLSLIWYYLFSCQDCGVFRIWKGLVKQGDND